MKKLFAIYIILLSACLALQAQSKIVKDFKDACDSLNTLMSERTSVEGCIVLKAVMKRDQDRYGKTKSEDSTGEESLSPGRGGGSGNRSH